MRKKDFDPAKLVGRVFRKRRSRKSATFFHVWEGIFKRGGVKKKG